jgi:hypothetical protein
MERDSAAQKREEWDNKLCKHISLDRETDRGKDTGNWACLTCGLAMPPIDWDNLRYGLSK